MLRPISFEALDKTLPILSRGFPGMPRQGWAAAIERLRRFGAPEPGRCVAHLLEAGGRDLVETAGPEMPGLRALGEVARASGPHAREITEALGRAWIAESYEAATAAARDSGAAVATPVSASAAATPTRQAHPRPTLAHNPIPGLLRSVI